MDKDIKAVLLSKKQIAEKVVQLAEKITEDYKNSDLMVIGILKGSVFFLTDLVREIKLPLNMDFMVVSSYGASTKSSGVVRIIKDLEMDIEGKDVLIVEDIVDTGLTLSYLMENLRSRNPKSLKLCSLLNKPERRKINITLDYNGFDIPDEFAVGYGLDYNENYRNLPDICILKQEVYSK